MTSNRLGITDNQTFFAKVVNQLGSCQSIGRDVCVLSDWMIFRMKELGWVQELDRAHFFSDNMMVPNRATHKANAERFMNYYYYDPAVAARLAAKLNYVCPVAGAREAMEKIAPALVDNPLIFPSDDFLRRTFMLKPLDETRSKRYEREFADAIGG